MRANPQQDIAEDVKGVLEGRELFSALIEKDRELLLGAFDYVNNHPGAKMQVQTWRPDGTVRSLDEFPCPFGGFNSKDSRPKGDAQDEGLAAEDVESC